MKTGMQWFFAAMVLLAGVGCTAPRYTERRQDGDRLERHIVVRELRLLRTRMRDWSRTVDSLHRTSDDPGDAVREARPYMRRLELGRRVERLLERKLARYDRMIPFSAVQLRMTYRAGCRRNRLTE